ncbi:hypothetical protein HMI56_000546 [Coelomomyces lativittatus]|nr:hypothetical protein HMI56_000546 [Coelomomyces lativittatus]
MPLCRDIRTGKKFRPHVIVASSSVMNRCTIGQTLEAWKGMETVGRTDFSPLERLPYSVVDIDTKFPYEGEVYQCNFTDISGVDFLRTPPSSNKRGLLIADYGICQFWHLCHLVRDKQHFMSYPPKGISSIRGRLQGSSVRLGEMEIHALLSKGMISCTQELLDNSDSCIVTICKVCNRLSLLCDCEKKDFRSLNYNDTKSLNDTTLKVITRSSLVKFDISQALQSYHSNFGIESSMSESSNLTRSFKYNV